MLCRLVLTTIPRRAYTGPSGEAVEDRDSALDGLVTEAWNPDARGPRSSRDGGARRADEPGGRIRAAGRCRVRTTRSSAAIDAIAARLGAGRTARLRRRRHIGATRTGRRGRMRVDLRVFPADASWRSSPAAPRAQRSHRSMRRTTPTAGRGDRDPRHRRRTMRLSGSAPAAARRTCSARSRKRDARGCTVALTCVEGL